MWDGSDWSFGTLATSLFKVFYAYSGLSNLNNVMNEVKRPVRTLRSVSIAALLTACLVKLLFFRSLLSSAFSSSLQYARSG